MQIEYELTPDDWGAFGEYNARNSPQFQRAKNRRGVLNVVLLALSIGVAASIFAKSPVPLIIAICAAIGASWNASGRLITEVRTQMTSMERACLRGQHSLEVLPEGLRFRCDVSDSTIAWRGIRDVVETNDHVFVMLDEMQGYVVPKQRVISGDVRTFLLEVAKFRTAHKE